MTETISAPSFLPPLLIHRVNLRCILLPAPKSHPHCQVCPWQGCASLCAKVHRNDPKESKPKAHVNDAQQYFHLLDTLKQLPMSPFLVALELHQTSRPCVCLTSSACFHIPIPLSPTLLVCKPHVLLCPINTRYSLFLGKRKWTEAESSSRSCVQPSHLLLFYIFFYRWFLMNVCLSVTLPEPA